MITYEEFEEIVVNTLKRDISSNEEQKKSILSNVNQSQFIVAGPGSGKTTVIVLKILKYIFVDDINPSEIISTTFTRKAADELYSRILNWGDQIKNILLEKYGDDFNKISALVRIDFNQIIIGTIDSVAEELIRIHRAPGENSPTLIEGFVAKSAMINTGLLKNDRYLNEDLQDFLKEFDGREKLNDPSKMSRILISLKDRLYFDQVDFNDVYENVKNNPGAVEALNAIADYEKELKKRNLLDFPMLEEEFLKRLRENQLTEFLNNVKVILVDEYQDTNLIQEEIYFTIAKSALENNGNITVVGDDDQSLYRFRGATVDLFTNFKERANEKLGIEVEEINLRTNYRSTEKIINQCNSFVELDKKYQSARVHNKPKIIAPDFKENEMPILGMFRNNPEMLSKDLSTLIGKLINKGEVEVPVYRVITREYNEMMNSSLSRDEKQKEKQKYLKEGKKIKNITLKLDKENGSASDIAILTYSPKETNNSGSRLFPFYLRKHLSRLREPISVFNPRGKDLQEVYEVSIFCGLLLECIDPESKVQNSDKQIPMLAKRNMRRWRLNAREYIKEDPQPHYPLSLEEFVRAWQEREPIGHEKWPESASLMELAYKLITWIEELQDDVEGIVYLEAITQSITQTGFFNKYSANIVHGNEKEEYESIKEAIWNIFIPIATGDVEIDEALLETLPNDRINLMSIHQSKGLEFPLVVVDVGSKFKKNEAKTQNLRFPKMPSKKKSLEDTVRNYSSLGKLERSEKDRSFDDLVRLYFVAFSRAENVLLLIGLTQGIDGYSDKNELKTIPNVALGWSRDEKFIGFNEMYMI